MLSTLKLLAGELAETMIRPRIEKAKIDLKMAIVTGAVVVLFALLAMLCLFVFVFLQLADATSPREAALILFGFSLFVCLGAVVAHAIGKRVEQRAYERKTAGQAQVFTQKLPGRDFDVAQYAHNKFADNKASALIAAAVAGIVIGVKPALVFKTAAKLFLSHKRNQRDDKDNRSNPGKRR